MWAGGARLGHVGEAEGGEADPVGFDGCNDWLLWLSSGGGADCGGGAGVTGTRRLATCQGRWG